MALNEGIRDPKRKVTNIKSGTNLKSLIVGSRPVNQMAVSINTGTLM